jgi:hypothetical protein
MHAWKHEESYRVHQAMLQEIFDRYIDNLRKSKPEMCGFYQGYLEAIEDVKGLAETTIRLHNVRGTR